MRRRGKDSRHKEISLRPSFAWEDDDGEMYFVKVRVHTKCVFSSLQSQLKTGKELIFEIKLKVCIFYPFFLAKKNRNGKRKANETEDIGKLNYVECNRQQKYLKQKEWLVYKS